VRGVLGQGGTAIVYDAFHSRLQTRVAVKVLAITGPSAQEARARLLREAQICAALDDPHFPRIYDVDELPDGTPYIVLEYIRGSALSEVIGQGQLSVEYTYAIAQQLLLALSVLHGAGIVHRDIKPANMLIQQQSHGMPRVRLVDFGIAKIVAEARDLASLTHQGALVGTPHYMSPEQLMGRHVDVRTDLYAVGVVLYEMLTGRVPFDAATISEVIAAVLRDPVPPLASLRPDCPRALQAVVARAMLRDPNLRYVSAEEMLADLEAACASNRSQLRLRISEPEEPVRRRPWASRLLAGAVIGASALALWTVALRPDALTRAKERLVDARPAPPAAASQARGPAASVPVPQATPTLARPPVIEALDHPQLAAPDAATPGTVTLVTPGEPTPEGTPKITDPLSPPPQDPSYKLHVDVDSLALDNARAESSDAAVAPAAASVETPAPAKRPARHRERYRPAGEYAQTPPAEGTELAPYVERLEQLLKQRQAPPPAAPEPPREKNADGLPVNPYEER